MPLGDSVDNLLVIRMALGWDFDVPLAPRKSSQGYQTRASGKRTQLPKSLQQFSGPMVGIRRAAAVPAEEHLATALKGCLEKKIASRISASQEASSGYRR
jgi:hypothetical protein